MNSFERGDHVSPIVGTHITRFRVDHRGLAKIPDTISFEEASAVPVAHATAYYAFVCIAKLRKGHSFLIYATARSVRQAEV